MTRPLTPTGRLDQLTGDSHIDAALRNLSAILADIATTANGLNQEGDEGAIQQSELVLRGGNEKMETE